MTNERETSKEGNLAGFVGNGLGLKSEGEAYVFLNSSLSQNEIAERADAVNVKGLKIGTESNPFPRASFNRMITAKLKNATNLETAEQLYKIVRSPLFKEEIVAGVFYEIDGRATEYNPK